MNAQSTITMTGLDPSIFWPIIGVSLVLALAQIAGMWAAFHKAGHPGWAAIIPIYNLYILCKMAGRPGWWWLLCLVPVLNVIIIIIVFVDIAKHFGKGVGFAIGMLFLGLIFWLILGFGSAQYQAPMHGAHEAA